MSYNWINDEKLYTKYLEQEIPDYDEMPGVNLDPEYETDVQASVKDTPSANEGSQLDNGTGGVKKVG